MGLLEVSNHLATTTLGVPVTFWQNVSQIHNIQCQIPPPLAPVAMTRAEVVAEVPKWRC